MKDLETDVHNVGVFSVPTVNRNCNFINFCSDRLLQDQCNSFTMPHEIIGRCHCGTCQGFFCHYHGYVARAHDLKYVHTTYKYMYSSIWFMSNELAEFVPSLLSVLTRLTESGHTLVIRGH